MKVDVVVDVGNSRIKWGRCAEHRVALSSSLPPDEPLAWLKQLNDWNLSSPLVWAVSGVHPARCGALVDWLREKGQTVWPLERAKQLPLEVLLDHPDRVGIDRLLNAVAAKDRIQRMVPKIAIDAGTAVTVDLIDEEGRFRGGAISPGFLLMAQSTEFRSL